MSRDGFRVADADVNFYADPKVNALARRLRDPVRTAAYAALYDATVRASWQAGRRVTFDEALPAWWLDDPDDALANLRAVGLLDDEARIPEHAWASWYEVAAQRRDDRRFEGTVGGLMKSLAMSRDEAVAEARRRLSLGGPEPALAEPRPDLARSVPTVPTVPTDPSRPGTKRGDSLANVARSRPGSKADRDREEVQDAYFATAEPE